VQVRLSGGGLCTIGSGGRDDRSKREEQLTATKHGKSHGLGIGELVLAVRDVQGRHFAPFRMKLGGNIP
jgi:hypothetical protein